MAFVDSSSLRTFGIFRTVLLQEFELDFLFTLIFFIFQSIKVDCLREGVIFYEGPTWIIFLLQPILMTWKYAKFEIRMPKSKTYSLTKTPLKN